MRLNHLFLSFVLLSVILLIPLSIFSLQSHATTLVVNSNDWRTVYSASLFASLTAQPYKYIISTTQANLLPDAIPLDEDLILVEDTPIAMGYSTILSNRGFKVSPSSGNPNLNLRFAEQSNLNNFVVVSDAFGYNALGMTPYAVTSKSFVIFANKKNINEVESFLSTVSPKRLVLYGRMDREVKDVLIKYNPQIINTGDRFSDNLEAMNLFYREGGKSAQVVLTNGESIEPSIMTGTNPIFFIGESRAPEQVIQFLRSHPDIEVGVVIGPELIDPAKQIKDATKIRLLVKFAQGRNEQFYSLDRFPIPKANLKLKVQSVRYNILTKQLEVVYSNDGDATAYALATSHEVFQGDKSINKRVGDADPVAIASNDVTTALYDIDLTDYTDSVLSVKSDIIFGEAPNSLDRVLAGKFPVELIRVQDDSELVVRGVVYNPATRRFEISVENTGPGTLFLSPNIVDLTQSGDLNSFAGVVERLAPGVQSVVTIRAELNDADIADNPQVKVRVKYGSRVDGLIKLNERSFDLVVSGGIPPFVWILLVVVLLLLFLIFRKKKRKA